ncbi:MAG: hypothetical protein V4671_15170 [Armatimonadota bacterium]
MSNTAYDNDRNLVTTDELNDDTVQHGIDDDASGDAEKGATLGGVGGAVTGAVAGAAAGPLGAIAGAIIGGVAGAVASGAAVAAIDRVDNDNTITGIGSGATTDVEDAAYTTTGVNSPGNGVPGIQTGGYTAAGTPDTRGITEKAADAVTGDRIDDKTGLPVAGGYTTGVGTSGAYGTGTGSATAYNTDPDGTAGVNRLEELGETTPSLKTGGYANDGTPDTRGVGEKVVDAVTGDVVDDKTHKVVDHR